MCRFLLILAALHKFGKIEFIIDPYGPILKRQRFRLWPEVEKKKQ